MDELLKALAEAVKMGSALAYPALVGYYITSVLGTLLPCTMVVACVWIIASHCTKTTIARNDALRALLYQNNVDVPEHLQ